MAAAPVFVGTPKLGLLALTTSNYGDITAVVTGGTEGSKVVGLIATSAMVDTSAQVFLVRGGNQYPLVTVALPASAGTDATVPPVDLLAAAVGLPVDNDGQAYLMLESGDALSVATSDDPGGLGGSAAFVAIYGDL
jgi:hypothetical protein